MAINSFKYGLRDCKIAPWISTGVWGAAVDVLAIQLVGFEETTSNGILQGDDVEIDSHAKPISANVRIRFGFNDLEVISVLTGITLGAYTNYEMITFGQDDHAYFGICGQVYATHDGGDTQIFVPKVKLIEGLSFTFEFGAYVTPEISCKAHYDGSTYGIGKLISNKTAQTVTIPPTMMS